MQLSTVDSSVAYEKNRFPLYFALLPEQLLLFFTFKSIFNASTFLLVSVLGKLNLQDVKINMK